MRVFALPDVGEGLTEAEILTWHVSPGDTVAVNQVIVEIETAKAAVELPSPYAGTVAELHAAPGDIVAVGVPIISFADGAEATRGAGARAAVANGAAAGSVSLEKAATPAAADGSGAKIGETTADGRIATLVGYVAAPGAVRRRARRAQTAGSATSGAQGLSGAQGSSGAQRPAEGRVAVPAAVPLATPPVRKLARELGVDLRALAGSGPRGVITRDDVLAGATRNGSSRPSGSAIAAAPTATGPTGTGPTATEAAPHAPAAAQVPADGVRREPVRGVRRATAAAMVASAFSAPHVTEFLTVDVTPMIELRDRLRARPEWAEVKLSPLVFAAKAVCLAVRRTPEANASWHGEEIWYHDRVQLGIAAATPRGLIVPKIRDANTLSLRELARELTALTERARAGTTAPSDLVNGTITITNVGVFGVDTGTPILNPGESVILALGAVKQAPWVLDGELAVRTVCQLALSFDHRVVDGEQGSRFLADVGALLADPGLALTY